MLPQRLSGILMLLTIALFFQAYSYSIIISNKNGTPQPDPNHHEMGFYNLKEVHCIDTVIPLSILQNGAMLVANSPAGGFHSVEYKITFGAMLRNTFTFGKRRSIKVKYTCLKNSN